MSKNHPEYPIRLHGYGAIVAIRLPKAMGGSAKIFLRDVAKNQVRALYFKKISCDITGKTNSGDAISIDTVGKWLFGAPGYMGHIRVSNWEGRDCKVEFPQNAPAEVKDLIDAVKAEVESIKK